MPVLFLYSDEKNTVNTALSESVPKIEKAVEKIRQRTFEKSCKKGVKNTKQIHNFLSKRFEEEFNADIAAFYTALYREFCLISKDTDLRKVLINLFTGQVAGFYDPREKTFYLSDKATFMTDAIIAHELTHALQDCHLPLEKTLYLQDLAFNPFSTVRNDDIYLARISFLEGEAQIVTSKFIAKKGLMFKPDYLKMSDYGTLISSQIQMSLAPPVIANQLMFPYTKGHHFMQILYRIEGWKSVNEAYSRLPRSSEQIIHPEKYVNKEDPVFIVIPGLAKLKKDGWKQAGRTCLGEFMINEIVRTMTSGFPKGVRASCGWGGDTIYLFTKDRTNFILWYTVWDSEKDANEFFIYFQDGLRRKYLKKGIKTEKTGMSFLLKGSRCRYLEKKGKDVFYISGLQEQNTKRAAKLLEKVKYLTWEQRFAKKNKKEEPNKTEKEGEGNE
jgi:hypothetical protein